MPKPVPPRRRKKRKPDQKFQPPPTVMWIGLDTSLQSLALAALGFDGVLNKKLGPAFALKRWNKDTHYFTRLEDCVRCHELLWDLQVDLRIGGVPLNNIYIAIEEPWPFGMASRGSKFYSSALKQQAEITGAVMSGFLRFGYKNLYQIHNTWWRKLVADDLEITIAPKKWNHDGRGKWRTKEWALQKFDGNVPDFPDLIQTAQGKVPKPEGSRAIPRQPDDRYDALAMATWMQDNYLS